MGDMLSFKPNQANLTNQWTENGSVCNYSKSAHATKYSAREFSPNQLGKCGIHKKVCWGITYERDLGGKGREWQSKVWFEGRGMLLQKYVNK